MQFSVIGKWLIDGVSPHTGLPVLETCRIVAHPKLQQQCDGDWFYDGAVWSARVWKGYDDTRDYVPCRDGGIATRAHAKYRIGQTYSIQLGRGQKSIGRTPPIESIYRQDVREMTPQQARWRGFTSIEAYLDVWTRMHDPAVLLLEPIPGKGGWLGGLKRKWKQGVVWHDLISGLCERPAERYDAWVIRFAAAPDDGTQHRAFGEGSE